MIRLLITLSSLLTLVFGNNIPHRLEVIDKNISTMIIKTTKPAQVVNTQMPLSKNGAEKYIIEMKKDIKEIKALEKEINARLKQFYEIYDVANDYLEHTDCRMMNVAIKYLNDAIDDIKPLQNKLDGMQLEQSDLLTMLSNLKKEKEKVCKEKQK